MSSPQRGAARRAFLSRRVASNAAFSKHGQVKGDFNRELIKTGILPLHMGKLYNKAFEYRQKFDYVDFVVPDRDMVSEFIDKAGEFRANIHQYIQTQQQLPKS